MSDIVKNIKDQAIDLGYAKQLAEWARTYVVDDKDDMAKKPNKGDGQIDWAIKTMRLSDDAIQEYFDDWFNEIMVENLMKNEDSEFQAKVKASVTGQLSAAHLSAVGRRLWMDASREGRVGPKHMMELNEYFPKVMTMGKLPFNSKVGKDAKSHIELHKLSDEVVAILSGVTETEASKKKTSTLEKNKRVYKLEDRNVVNVNWVALYFYWRSLNTKAYQIGERHATTDLRARLIASRYDGAIVPQYALLDYCVRTDICSVQEAEVIEAYKTLAYKEIEFKVPWNAKNASEAYKDVKGKKAEI